MNLEEQIKEKLLARGFTKEKLLNNRGLIGATIIEATSLTPQPIKVDEIKQLKSKVKELERKYSHRCNEVKGKVETIHNYLKELTELKEGVDKIDTMLNKSQISCDSDVIENEFRIILEQILD